jgi:hypothetical protein
MWETKWGTIMFWIVLIGLVVLMGWATATGYSDNGSGYTGN